MTVEINSEVIGKSLAEAQEFNSELAQSKQQVVDLTAGLVQSATSPLMLSQKGIVLTPRVWQQEAKKTFVHIAQTSRLGLQQIAEYLATSESGVASGIRKNMLGGRHFGTFEEALKVEAEKGISAYPFEVGRTDIINGGALEVNAACLDAPADLHDLGLFHQSLLKAMDGGEGFNLETVQENSVVELIVDTMLAQVEANSSGIEKPVLAWLGTAKEVYGARDNGGYWPRELRFKQIAQDYLKRIGSNAEFRLVCVEQLEDPRLVAGIGSAYRNLLPEDMEPQSQNAIRGLCELATSGRLVGSLTAELITNKAAMAIITSPELSAEAGIQRKDWELYSSVFPPTAFLSSREICWEGQMTDLQWLIENSRDKLFFKLSNGEEGRGVWSGEAVDEEQMRHFMELVREDPYAVLVQKKLKHVPFEAVVVDLSEFKGDFMQGETDMGTHYQLLKGRLSQRGNIVMTRFAPRNGYSVTTNDGGDGVFRPVATYTKK